MTTRPLLVADELGKTDEAALARSAHLRDFAADLSGLLKCPTDLVYVHPIDDILGERIFDAETRDRVTRTDLQKYDPLMKRFPQPGEMFIKIGRPVEQIVKLVHQEKSFEGVVIGTRALKGLERFFLGSVAEEVVRHLDRPVFILGPNAQEKKFTLKGHKSLTFVVATDLTKKCRAAETYAVSLAQRMGAHVKFYYSLAETLHTAKTFAYAAGEAMSSVDSLYEDIKKEAAESMDKKLSRLKELGLSCEGHIESKNQDVVQGILNYAGDATQMIFMGHQNIGFIASTVLGSNLRGMIAQSKVPVVVVRS